MSEQWFPQLGSKGQVVGRFKYLEIDDIAASRVADERKKKTIIVIEHKPVGGDLSVTPVKPFNEASLRARFPGAWEAFNGEEIKVDGTPLSEFGFTSDQIVALKIHGVFSAEQVAGMADAVCQSLGFGWRKIRDNTAAKFKEKVDRLLDPGRLAMLDQRVGNLEKPAPVAEPLKIEPQPDERDAKIAALEATVQALMARDGSAPEAPPARQKRKGWPKGRKRAKAAPAPSPEPVDTPEAA